MHTTTESAEAKAQQTPLKIREFIEEMSRLNGMRSFDLTYVDALGHVGSVLWDGKSTPVFTTFKPKPVVTYTEPSI